MPQCVRGAVHAGAYDAGSALAEAGVITGFDITVEAALAKLYYLFGSGLAPDAVRLQTRMDLRGELTTDASRARPAGQRGNKYDCE